MRRSFLFILPLSLALISHGAGAASLLELFLQTPVPPLDGPAAQTWVREGRIVGVEFLSFEARMQQEKASLMKPPVPGSTATADASAVLVAVRGYEAYQAQNSGDKDPVQVLGKRTAWIAKRFDGVRKRMGAQAVGDHNAVDDELRAWGGLFRDWQVSRRALVEKAERELAAVDDLAAVADAKSAEAIRAYRFAMLREIDVQASISRLAVERYITRP